MDIGNKLKNKYYRLERQVDVSGVSGVGVPANGVLSPRHGFLLVWNARTDEGAETDPSMQYHPHMENARRVHEHGGASKFVEVTDDSGIDEIVATIAVAITGYGEAVARGKIHKE